MTFIAEGDFTSKIADFLPTILGVFGAFIPLLLATLLTQHLRKYTAVWFTLFGLLIWIAHLLVMRKGLKWGYSPELTITLLAWSMVSTLVLLVLLRFLDAAAGATSQEAKRTAELEDAVHHEKLNGSISSNSTLSSLLANQARSLFRARQREAGWAAAAVLFYGSTILLLSIASSNHYGLGQVVMVELRSSKALKEVLYAESDSGDKARVSLIQQDRGGNAKEGFFYSIAMTQDGWTKLQSLELRPADKSIGEVIKKARFWRSIDRLAFGAAYCFDFDDPTSSGEALGNTTNPEHLKDK